MDIAAGWIFDVGQHTHPVFYALAPYWFLAFGVFMISPLTLLLPQYLQGSLSCPKRKDFKDEWIIYGKKYNLRPFFSQHPGGSWMLQAARGSECTGLFESYHVFVDRDVLLRLIANFEIKEPGAPPPPAPPMEFWDPFYQELKQMVRDHFRGKPRGAHKMTWPHIVACFLVWVLMWALIARMVFVPGDCKWVAPCIGVCSWYITGNVMHDASHGAFVRKPWVNRLMTYAAFPFGVSPSGWHIEHVLSHHIYTNEENDVDLYHYEPLVTLKKGVNSVSLLPHLLRLILVLSLSMLHLACVVPFQLLCGHVDPAHGHRAYDRVKAIEAHRAEIRPWVLIETIAPWIFFGIAGRYMGILKGFCYIMSIYTVSSFLFSFFTQLSHLQEHCFMDEKERSTTSFAKRQVSASVDFAADSFCVGHISGGLNTQALHHCFPSVSAMHLRDLYPKFRQICRKHDVPLKESVSLRDFLWGFVELSN